jgi:hypothetical protein
MSTIDGAIGGLMAAKQSAQQTQIAYAIQAKSMDALKQQGQVAVQLVEQAAQVAKSPDSGGTFDATG